MSSSHIFAIVYYNGGVKEIEHGRDFYFVIHVIQS